MVDDAYETLEATRIFLWLLAFSDGKFPKYPRTTKAIREEATKLMYTFPDSTRLLVLPTEN